MIKLKYPPKVGLPFYSKIIYLKQDSGLFLPPLNKAKSITVQNFFISKHFE